MHRALLDLAIVILGAAVVGALFTLLKAPFGGSTAVAVAVLLATWRLAHASGSWRDLGLTKPASRLRVAIAVVLIYVLVGALVVGVVNPIADTLGWAPLESATYANIRGNALALAGMLVLIWTIVAFGEEMLFRGFILSRLRELYGAGKLAASTAVVTQAALFGVAHFYLGARGVLTAAVVGLVYGSWYLFRDRNLWPLIIAHGVTDTISMTAIYAGVLQQ